MLSTDKYSAFSLSFLASVALLTVFYFITLHAMLYWYPSANDSAGQSSACCLRLSLALHIWLQCEPVLQLHRFCCMRCYEQDRACLAAAQMLLSHPQAPGWTAMLACPAAAHMLLVAWGLGFYAVHSCCCVVCSAMPAT